MGKIEQISLLSNFKILIFLKVPYFCRINSGLIFYMPKSFFLLANQMIPLKKGAKIQNEYMFLLRCICLLYTSDAADE